jgi:hypothetical protein
MTSSTYLLNVLLQIANKNGIQKQNKKKLGPKFLEEAIQFPLPPPQTLIDKWTSFQIHTGHCLSPNVFSYGLLKVVEKVGINGS